MRSSRGFMMRVLAGILIKIRCGIRAEKGDFSVK